MGDEGSGYAIGLRLDPVTSVAEPAQGAVRLARELLCRGGAR
jgi:hypothetical protein